MIVFGVGLNSRTPPPLAHLCLKILDNSHLRAWDAILYNQREKLAKPFDHWDVWGLNLATDDPTSPPIKPPTPPLGFPSRFDGNELLGKSEYEFQVRCYLETQFMLRLGELGLNYQMIAPWVIDYLKQLDAVQYWTNARERLDGTPILSMELRTIPGEENSEAVLANGKRTFMRAWAQVRND